MNIFKILYPEREVIKLAKTTRTTLYNKRYGFSEKINGKQYFYPPTLREGVHWIRQRTRVFYTPAGLNLILSQINKKEKP